MGFCLTVVMFCVHAGCVGTFNRNFLRHIFHEHLTMEVVNMTRNLVFTPSPH